MPSMPMSSPDIKETRYLIAAVLTGDGCFEEARTDGKERGKGSAGTEQVFAFFQAAALADDGIELAELVGQQPDRQAEFPQRTGRTQRFHLMCSIMRSHTVPFRVFCPIPIMCLLTHIKTGLSYCGILPNYPKFD